MKKQEKILQKLQQIIEPEFEQLKSNIIMVQDNRYHVFDQYTIEKSADDNYLVARHRREDKFFSTLPVAFSWCIADKHQNSALSYAIQNLDQERVRIAADVLVREFLLKQIKDPGRREITHIKISAKKQGLKSVENRLAKCVSLAKYYQIRGFNCDETARTRRTQTTR